MPDANDGFLEVGGGEAWSPKEVGDSITGEYVNTKKDVGPHNSQIHNLRTGDGIVGVWGSTVLDDKFLEVRVGDIVRVTYTGLGKATPGKQPFKTWKLEVKPGTGNSRGAVDSASTQPVQDDKPADSADNINLDDLPY